MMGSVSLKPNNTPEEQNNNYDDYDYDLKLKERKIANLQCAFTTSDYEKSKL